MKKSLSAKTGRLYDIQNANAILEHLSAAELPMRGISAENLVDSNPESTRAFYLQLMRVLLPYSSIILTRSYVDNSLRV